MILVFAATATEGADYIREHHLDGARCYSDLTVALAGFWIHEGDEVYLLPSASELAVGIVERQAGGLPTRPRIHRPVL